MVLSMSAGRVFAKPYQAATAFDSGEQPFEKLKSECNVIFPLPRRL
jgi:hypothetical protein